MSGTGGFDTSQPTAVGTTAAQIVARRRPRVAVTIINLGTTDVYVGHDASVTTANGALLVGIKGASLTIPTQEAIFGIVGSGTQGVAVIESY